MIRIYQTFLSIYITYSYKLIPRYAFLGLEKRRNRIPIHMSYYLTAVLKQQRIAEYLKGLLYTEKGVI